MNGSGTATPRVFMCHSSEDAALARALVAAMEDLGVPAWIAPRDVVSGQTYPAQIVHAISSTQTFAVLITDAATRSDHVLREIELACRHKKALLPIVVDGAMSDDIDYYLGPLHRITGTREDIVGLAREYFAQQPRTATSGPALGTPSPRCEAPAEDAHDKAVTELTIGVIPFPPFSNHPSGPQANPTGLYVELLDALAAEQDVTVTYRAITNEDTVRVLRDGDVDVVASLYRTPRRSQLFDFAACFFASTVGAIVREGDDRFNGQGDLLRDDVRIAVCQGEVGAELAADQFGALRGSRRLIEVDTVEVANIAGLVAAGVADIAITDNITCQLLVERSPGGLRHIFTAFPLYVGHIGLVLSQHREGLRDFLTDHLTRLRSTEPMQERERALLRDHPGVLQSL